jgi:hypothetical protein
MLPCAAYSMELVARRLAVKTLSIQTETLPRRVQGRLSWRPLSIAPRRVPSLEAQSPPESEILAEDRNARPGLEIFVFGFLIASLLALSATK